MTMAIFSWPASSLLLSATSILLFLAHSPLVAIAFRPPAQTRLAGMPDDAPALRASSASQPPSPPPLVPRDALLSALTHAALLGARTVSSLSDEARSGDVQFKEAGDARSALTVADTAAQRVIASSVLAAYPALRVIGEEDETVEPDAASRRELRTDLLDGCAWTVPPPPGIIGVDDEREEEPPPAELDVSRVTVYVDPLDGTREFVEGRLANVQTLIGVCYEGRPVMGAVGLPFPTDGGTEAEVLFGMVGKGIGKLGAGSVGEGIVDLPLPELRQHRKGGTIHVSSGDSQIVVAAVDLAERTFRSEGGVTRQIVGATGNKLLQVLCGHTTLALLHDKTSLWDTAAPTALLAAMGGRVTDYFGDPLVYDHDAGEVRNSLCVVASAPGAGEEHERLVEAMREDRAAIMERLKRKK